MAYYRNHNLTIHGEVGSDVRKVVLAILIIVTVKYFSFNWVNDLTLAIFDLLGNRIITLEKSKQLSGKHQISFNGHSLSEGIYQLRFTNGHDAISKKFVIVR